MLPKKYKFKVRNDGGVTTTMTVTWLPHKVGSAGALTYDAGGLQTPINAASVASAATSLSSAVDNTTALNHGGNGVFTVNPGSTPSGNKSYYLFFVGSDDGTTTFGDEERLVATIVATATGAVSAAFEIPI
jgi:hypothetical protein